MLSRHVAPDCELGRPTISSTEVSLHLMGAVLVSAVSNKHFTEETSNLEKRTINEGASLQPGSFIKSARIQEANAHDIIPTWIFAAAISGSISNWSVAS